jgi:mRNA interferase MazF
LVQPDEHNGLREPSRLMVDKLSTIPRAKLRSRIGQLDDEGIVQLNRALVVFLGLAGPPADRLS